MLANPAVCLNCGAQLGGSFCSQCGQRAVAAYPTTREMVGDVWVEVSGWDGRFARSFRTLIQRPGVLTVEALEGRRARYVSPVRLYLVASITYFLLAALSPNAPRTAQLPGPDQITINMLDPNPMTPEERAAAEHSLGRAPWWAQAMLRLPVLTDPVKFRRDFLETLPRVLFV
ncbi:MAG: DUF3667 domain-containing protein, partial [Acidobacteria bacterium]|nr:DUF3667 domain-containing protein [Acidobacteriota bacterium]